MFYGIVIQSLQCGERHLWWSLEAATVFAASLERRVLAASLGGESWRWVLSGPLATLAGDFTRGLYQETLLTDSIKGL